MFLLALLPSVSLVLIFIIIYSRLNSAGNFCIRAALINSSLILSLFVAAITELLSYYKLLRFDWLLVSWIVLSAGLAGYIWHKKLFLVPVKQILNQARHRISSDRVILLIAALLFISLFIALIYPPNNFDSLTYHMARVAHWEQNESISHYKTHNIRQLIFPPFGEWVILHLQILGGTDRFANAVQLVFLTGCIVAVSLIAKQLGANARQQLLAAAMTCFIPMAVLQSNTTQNDIVVAFFILIFVYLSTKLFHKFRFSVLLLSGVSLGLAWLTKGTAYLFTGIFCGWYLLMIIKDYRQPLKGLLKKALAYSLIPLIAIAINYGHFYRNVFLTGSPLGDGGEGTVNEAFAIKPLVLVAVKNLMNHLPVTESMKETVVRKATEAGLDPNDPKYNFMDIRWMAEGFSFHEDYAQNFLHVILISVCLVLYFSRKDIYNRPPDLSLLFILSVLFSTCLFSVLLQWQPWSNRLELPLFMLYAVFMGLEIGRSRKWMQTLCLVPLMAYGFIALALNSRHPLLPVTKSIFTKPYTDFIYDKEFLDLQQYIKGTPYTKIGLYIGANSWDYCYYKLLRGRGSNKRILQHVFVDNKSIVYLDDFIPDAIITHESSVESFTIKDKVYYKTQVFNKDAVLYQQR